MDERNSADEESRGRSEYIAGSTLRAASESLGWPLTLYLIAIIILTTLAPFDFQWPPRVRMSLGSIFSREMLKDIVANVLLFIPVGFTLRLGGGPDRSRIRITLWAGAFSIIIELLQTMLRTRVTSGLDVGMNVLGAWIGAYLFDSVLEHLNRKRVSDLALELPLSAAFYLLIPILWVNALLLPSYPDRIWLNVPLGLCGGLMLGAIGHHRLGPAGVSTAGGVVLVTGIWMTLASIPGFFTKNVELVASTLGTIAASLFLVGLATSLPSLAFGKARRFEGACLVRVLPVFCLYLILDALFPFERLGDEWRWRWGFDHLVWKYPTVPLPGVFALVEHGVSYVFLGFILAGLRGRVRESRESMLTNVGMRGLIMIAGTELLRGFHPQHHASAAHALLGMGGVLLGAYLYRMHLRTVWLVLGRLPTGT